jgi:hypothetical protein
MNWTYDPTKSKYTKELMEKVGSESTSYYEVFRKLDLKPTGSANGRIRVIVSKLGIDTSHFLGMRANCGPNHVGGPQKVHWTVILTNDRLDGKKTKPKYLRLALIESGVKEECEECHLPPIWNEKPLRLQIDHRNGDCLDNRPGNPRFLCPNCHAQTPNFGSSNMTKTLGKKSWAKGRTKKHRSRANAQVA